MDLLEFGMKHADSSSKLKRTAARGAIAIEKKWADLYEAWIERKKISFPQGPEEDAAMLEKIMQKIASENLQ